MKKTYVISSIAILGILFGLTGCHPKLGNIKASGKYITGNSSGPSTSNPDSLPTTATSTSPATRTPKVTPATNNVGASSKSGTQNAASVKPAPSSSGSGSKNTSKNTSKTHTTSSTSQSTSTSGSGTTNNNVSPVPAATTNTQTTATQNTTQGTQSGTNNVATNSSAPSAPSTLSQIESDLANQDTTFHVTVSGSQNLSTLLKTAMDNEPYIQWIIASYDWDSLGNVKVKYRETKTQTDYVRTHAQEIVNQITSPSMTPFAKEAAIHKWIVQKVQYDQSLQNYTAYDALVHSSAVCQGYALLAYRMLTDAGIKTEFVSGTADGQAHLWNEVYIDGAWYQLDVTWDDPVGDAQSYVSYGYFNLTNQQLAATHQWTASKYPVADTHFSSTLKSLIKSDPSHSQQYNALLVDIGGNLAVADTPSALAPMIASAVQQKQKTLSVRIQSLEKNVPSFVTKALKQANINVSLSYSYSSDERHVGYAIVNFTFTY